MSAGIGTREDVMTTFILAAAIIAAGATLVLATPAAQAQGRSKSDPSEQQGGGKTPMQLIEEDKRREQAEIDRLYDKRLKAPAAEAKDDDPWRTVRPAEAKGKQKR